MGVYGVYSGVWRVFELATKTTFAAACTALIPAAAASHFFAERHAMMTVDPLLAKCMEV